jgi:hypothetical protein
VRDEGAVVGGRRLGQNAARGYNSNQALEYHSDNSDAVGLLCLQPGRRGGVSTIVSTTWLHDRLLRERPDLLAPLYEPHAHTNLDDVDPDQPPYQYTPTFSWYEGRLSTVYKISHIVYTHRVFPELGELDPRILEAQALLDTWAEEGQFDMRFEVGDLQLLDNFAVAHSRTAFEDPEDPARRRHLLRLWHTLHDRRPLAPGFGWNAGLVDEHGGRGGVWRRLPVGTI